MATPTGTISLSDVNTELGKSSTATISLNDSDVRDLAGVASGAISMDDLRGKSLATVNFDITNKTVSNLGTAIPRLKVLFDADGTYTVSKRTNTWSVVQTGNWINPTSAGSNGYDLFVSGTGDFDTDFDDSISTDVEIQGASDSILTGTITVKVVLNATVMHTDTFTLTLSHIELGGGL